MVGGVKVVSGDVQQGTSRQLFGDMTHLSQSLTTSRRVAALVILGGGNAAIFSRNVFSILLLGSCSG